MTDGKEGWECSVEGPVGNWYLICWVMGCYDQIWLELGLRSAGGPVGRRRGRGWAGGGASSCWRLWNEGGEHTL